MAGNYADLPGPKVPYDVDGSVAFNLNVNAGTVALATAAQTRAFNSVTGSVFNLGDNPQNNMVGVIFVEPYDLTHYFLKVSNAGLNSWSWSANTTNGQDGTWTAISGTPTASGSARPHYRTAIQAFPSSLTGVKGIRVQHSSGYSGSSRIIQAWSFFGTPTAATGKRLEFWHPTLDQRLGAAALDFGDQPRSAVNTRDFRIKNASSTLTATGVTVASDEPDASNPTLASQHSFSVAGGSYAATGSLGDLAPGAISSVVTLRQSLLSNAQLGLATQRVLATATGWS